MTEQQNEYHVTFDFGETRNLTDSTINQIVVTINMILKKHT